MEPREPEPSSVNDVSIVIVHYNGADQLRRCLRSVLLSDAGEAEVIVVDNASLDSCTETVGPEFPAVRFVKSGSNLGSAGGWNMGATESSRGILVFLNDDVVVPPRWLGLLGSNLSDQKTGCVGGIALFLDHPDQINSAGGLLDFLGFGQNRAIGASREAFQGNSSPRPFYAVGTVFATRRDVWEKAGGFDERMFMYADDLDWSWRVRLLGYDIVLDERVIVQHKWRGSALKIDRMVYFLERNEIRALMKNYRTATLIWIAPPLLAVKLAKACGLALVDRPLLAAILSAWYWNLRMLPDTLAKRKGVQSARRVPDRAIIREMVLESLEVRNAFRRTEHPLRSLVGDRSASD